MKRATILLIMFLSISLSLAEMHPQPAFEDATRWAKTQTHKITEKTENLNPNEVPGFETSTPAEIKFDAGNLSTSAAQEASKSELGTVVREGFQKRPTGLVNKQDEWLKKGTSLEKSDNPAEILATHYKDCTPIQAAGAQQYQILTCDETVDAEQKSCTVGQIVEVDAKHTYQCQSTRQKEKQSCQKILNIQIEDKTEQKPTCTTGSIIATGTGALIPHVHCDIDSPTVTIDFACIYNDYRVTYAVALNSSGKFNFKGCKRRNWSVDKPKYHLNCENEQCILSANVHGRDSDDIGVTFERPRTVTTTQKVVKEAWDNQCASLEARVQ